MNEKERQPALTPLMAQYQSIKAQHAGEVLFFRLGDFYEMFDSDAEEISRLLNLTLTHRAGHPMCGVPYHASRIYIARLLRLGKKIAVCEQLNLSENGKGLAERKVVEIITPGTAVEEDYLEQNAHNFLSAVCFASPKRSEVSFAYIDISTGAFYATHWQFSDTLEEFSKELGRVLPRELIISRSLYEHKDTAKILENFPFISINTEDDWRFDREAAYKQLLHQFGTVNLHSFSLADSSPEVPAAGCLVGYILRTSAVSRTDAKLPQITSL
ncbi:MAG: DNA mismatch repair protein MutS, partial [Treponema lecithinolyticum]